MGAPSSANLYTASQFPRIPKTGNRFGPVYFIRLSGQAAPGFAWQASGSIMPCVRNAPGLFYQNSARSAPFSGTPLPPSHFLKSLKSMVWRWRSR
jgi:hypothetical protein